MSSLDFHAILGFHSLLLCCFRRYFYLKISLFYFLDMSVLPICVYVCHMHVWYHQNPLELKYWMLVSHVGSGCWTQDLCKRNKDSEPRSHPSWSTSRDFNLRFLEIVYSQSGSQSSRLEWIYTFHRKSLGHENKCFSDKLGILQGALQRRFISR